MVTDTVLTKIQAHRECDKSSETPVSPFIRGSNLPPFALVYILYSPPRKGCVIDGQATKASDKCVPLPPSRSTLHLSYRVA